MGFRILSTETVFFDGRNRMYDVVSRHLDTPAPRYFITYNDGRPMISGEVLPDFRRYVVLHELFEFETFKSDKGGCLKSLKEELKSVSLEDKERYIPFRRQVFLELLRFLKKYTPNSPLVHEVSESTDYLNEILIQKR